jgi:predicted transglutaminase-like cysteine proteinase
MTPLERLIAEASVMPDPEKIVLVHQFFDSHIEWKTDCEVYDSTEYWATPTEVMERKAGDCEDIAIAKYFVLRDAGMSDDHLKLVYGQICKEDTWVPHMVLMCHSWDGQIILDNVNNKIMPENSRWDFISILAFNLSGIWIFKNGHPKLITTNCKRLKKWKELIERYEMSEMCMRNFRHDADGA